MKSATSLPLSHALTIFVLITVVTALAVGVGSFVGFTARDVEVDGWRQAYKQAAANVPEWTHGTDKKYGKYSLVTFDHGKNYYAAVKKDGGILIIGFANNVYPGILKKLEQQPKWEVLPGVETKRRNIIFT